MPKVSQEYRDARREQILNAARACFLREGFHATSMQDVFAESGLSSGAVYRYFVSKDAMIIAIIEENLSDVIAMIHAVAAGEPERSMGEILADVLDFVTTRQRQSRFADVALLVWSETLRNPELAARVAKLVRQLQADITSVVRVHQEAGNLPPDVSPTALAAVLSAILPGLEVQLAVLGPRAAKDAPGALRALWPHAAR